MKKILITTTDSLYGWEIEAYLKPIFASVVLGTNAFADFSASFSDFFGGRSSSYEKRLQLIKDNAIATLTNKASELGANCILGLKIDVDQISGKNMQMFMITAGGTAVIAKNTKHQAEVTQLKDINKDLVKEKAHIIRLAKKYKNLTTTVDTEELRTIAESQSIEFKDYILAKLKAMATAVVDNEHFKLYKEYFGRLEPKDAIAALYPVLLTETAEGFIKTIVTIIREYDLLDYSGVYKLLEGSLSQKKIALNVLLAYKPSYGSDDLLAINEVIEHLIKDSFPNLSTTTIKKGFLSSTEKEAWTCQCGSTNAVETKYCGRCYNDQQGFHSDELKPSQVAEVLNDRLTALKSFL